MTYQTDSTILATDFNTFAGDTASSSAYASDVLATSKVAALYGIGFGSRGYGQSAYSLSPVAVGNNISSAGWTSLRDALATLCAQTNTPTTNLPAASYFNAGTTIVAADGTPGPENLATVIAAVDAARTTGNPAGMSLTSNVLTMTRATQWNTSINGQIRATFTSAEAARFFFNTGGQIRFRFAQPGVTAQSTSWNNVFTGVGTVSFGALSTTRSGSTGTPGIGYYDLSTSNLSILSAVNVGGGAYAANDMYVNAAYTGVTTNGAKGNVVNFALQLDDQHSNVHFDMVQAGTVVYVDIYKATSNVSGIETPTMSIVTNW